jgi:C4-dicarboxylate transporter DctQ subunit
MRKLRTKFSVIFDRLVDLFAVVSGIFMAAAMLAVSFEVATRYFLNRPITWVIEATQYALVFITFLGAAWVLRVDGHVTMDYVINRLSQRLQNLINAITYIICAVLCLVISVYGTLVTCDYYQTNYLNEGSVRVPAWLFSAVIPVGFILFFIQFLKKVYEFLRKLRVS